MLWGYKLTLTHTQVHKYIPKGINLRIVYGTHMKVVVSDYQQTKHPVTLSFYIEIMLLSVFAMNRAYGQPLIYTARQQLKDIWIVRTNNDPALRKSNAISTSLPVSWFSVHLWQWLVRLHVCFPLFVVRQDVFCLIYLYTFFVCPAHDYIYFTNRGCKIT